ncbi:MAG TPA: NAD-glutamate dehydrogenase domain-containing protein [Candidatus Eisenbacteria bacterium]|nr:NAD-glutamate dehydrogenase domain-containing protein [Candidatus Eisenbacteria bacterium]
MGVPAESGAKDRGRVAERLAALLARKVTAADAGALGAFTTQLLQRAQAYTGGVADEEAVQLVLSAFRFFQAPGPLPRVRVLTPTYLDEGWDAPGTVIETCIGDRPFIVDTVREELRAHGLEPRVLLHPIVAVTRDATGRAVQVDPPMHGASRESFLHIVVPRVTEPEKLATLESAIRARLDDIVLVTEDFGLALARAQAIATEFEQLGRTRDPRIAAEATAVGDFLRWLVDGGFVFLGYREYAFVDAPEGRMVHLRPGTGLGLLRREDRSAFRTPQPFEALSPVARRRVAGRRLLVVGKTHALAPVHRRVPMDDFGFAALDAAGNIVGERRFVGLLTSKAHAEEASEVPILRRMLRQILAAEGVISGSHDWKELVGVFNGLPKTLLFASSVDEVREDIQTILAAERTAEVLVRVRERGEGDLLTVLVVMPRSRVSGEARARVVRLVRERLDVELLEDHLDAGAEDIADAPARLHLTFTRGRAALDAATRATLEREVDAVLESWSVRLRELLIERHGVEVGERLGARFADAFPADYRASTTVERAADDVVLANLALTSGTPQIEFDREPQEGATVLRAYLAGPPLVLTEILPRLDHAGLRTLVEDRVRIEPVSAVPLYLHRFLVQDRAGRPLDVERVGKRLVDLILAVRGGRVPDDALNALVVATGLDWRAVDCLRSYAGYAVQAGLGTRTEVWATLAGNPEPAERLFACVAARFGRGDGDADADARARFVASLERVERLREDQCLRGLAALVAATVRTNVFARDAVSDRIVMKIRCADVPFLSDPRPRYEIYVRAPIVEGLHLRAGLVARGGLRLSDRPEDYRTEVLGLMRTQTMKNAIIVPTGAKGAFVPLRGGAPVDAYREFVRGLLEVTDNVVGGRVVHPAGLRIYDEEDPYLVVAADKGTATFSDEANAIARDNGFWLGDAFASGGSQGYDHKALGITARGAWECVRAHFHELEIDADTAPLRVIGIGDMGGDVFGNGLLRSPHLRLVAAFNHKHVFIDPDPDPAKSFAERERLFKAVAGWDQYDPAVRSPGALLALRGAKRIGLTPEVRRLLGVADEAMSGEALVRAILGLDVDLLWNGGIGTYVRATDETDASVGDPTNDSVRVPHTALRVRVVAEGGNLGVTQRGRIAFALAGGRINIDAIDNSAGVDLSDHEVNLKVCLAPLTASGRLSAEARNALLAVALPEVTEHVLAHNASQGRLLAIEQRRSASRLDDFCDHLGELERALGLDRAQLALPDWETLRARRATFPGLTRPELAVVTAYTKIHLEGALRASPLPDDPGLEPYLLGYFPRRIVADLPDAVRTHRLRREIVAVEVANTLVDALGATFVTRLQRETGATIPGVCRAWAIAWTLVDGAAIAHEIRTRRIGFADEVTCVLALEEAMRRMTRWTIQGVDPARTIAEATSELARGAAVARARLCDWLAGPEAEALHKRRADLEMCGLGPAALSLAVAGWIPSALDVVQLAGAAGLELEAVARRYFGLAAEIDFAWLASALVPSPDDDRWVVRALDGVDAELHAARRSLARRAEGAGFTQRVAAVRAMIEDLKASGRASLPALVVIVREIRQLAEASS